MMIKNNENDRKSMLKQTIKTPNKRKAVKINKTKQK